MTRFEIVSRVIEEEMAKPYEFGSADCFLLGCRVADALDPSRGMTATYSGRYKTQKQAQRLLLKLGHRSLVGLLETHLEPCGPALARMGDIVVVDRDGEEHITICSTSTRFIGKIETGRTWFWLDDAVKAFRT